MFQKAFCPSNLLLGSSMTTYSSILQDTRVCLTPSPHHNFKRIQPGTLYINAAPSRDTSEQRKKQCMLVSLQGPYTLLSVKCLLASYETLSYPASKNSDLPCTNHKLRRRDPAVLCLLCFREVLFSAETHLWGLPYQDHLVHGAVPDKVWRMRQDYPARRSGMGQSDTLLFRYQDLKYLQWKKHASSLLRSWQESLRVQHLCFKLRDPQQLKLSPSCDTH